MTHLKSWTECKDGHIELVLQAPTPRFGSWPPVGRAQIRRLWSRPCVVALCSNRDEVI
jgi:hypothetical protein